MTKTKILYMSPYQDFSGYAQASRDYIEALSVQPDLDIVCRALKYDSGNEYYGDIIARNECKDLQNVDVIINHTTPNEATYVEGVKNIAYFAWETNRVPAEWIKAVEKFDLILMPCDDNIAAYKAGGGKVRAEKLVHTFDLDKYKERRKPYELGIAEGKLKFYTVCQLSPKKNVERMIRSYYRAFDNHDDVVFIIKLYVSGQDMDKEKQEIATRFQHLKSMTRHMKHPPIFTIVNVMGDEEIRRLHQTCDVYMGATAADGFNIPAFDAMAHGNPVIATNWGGMREFVNNDNGWLVDYVLTPCFAMNHPHPFMYTSNEDWAEPSILDTSRCMREAYDEWKNNDLESRAMIGIKDSEKFSHEIVGNTMAEYIRSVL